MELFIILLNGKVTEKNLTLGKEKRTCMNIMT